jgi:predicted dehydrogenase
MVPILKAATMTHPVSIVLSGIGGMGSVYVKELLAKNNPALFTIEGVADPDPERCPQLGELLALDVPVFTSLESFYAAHRADLAVISSPIQFHSRQTVLALSRGSYVLCEKPAAATAQDVKKMIEARDRAGKRVAVGYQWSFSTAIQDLKKDIRAGVLGAPRFMKCLYLWPRDEIYYRRNDWAGKIKDSGGAWILDSPANNAMAHDLHNIFYVLGGERDLSVRPAEVEAELYRAHNIESFDTAAVRCRTEEGVDILFIVSHVSQRDTGPVFSYEFDGGTVSCRGRTTDISAVLIDGTMKNYGSPDAEPMKKLWDSVSMATKGGQPACGLEAAMSQTLCLNGIHDSQPSIVPFPKDIVRAAGEPGRRTVWVEGLDELLENCYEKGCLPSELEIAWAKKGRKIELLHYRQFPSSL